ncbi:MAG TPA: four-carbon acid sugar kinase family protein, partial [Negativicutes bacterium]
EWSENVNRLAIIADNLIGANDAGVQFSKFGFITQVIINPLDIVNYCKEVDVISLNTNTRNVSPEVAYDRVYQVAKQLQQLGFHRFYKKIDSTLRGNIGDEVRAMMEALSLPLAIIVPSYPAHGRIVEKGYLQLVQEWGDSNVPVPVYYIPTVLTADPAVPIAVISLDDVHQDEQSLVNKITQLHKAGVNLLVVDAVTDGDLRKIAIAINRLEISCLAVGSAGLAGNLPIAWKVVGLEHISLRQGTMIVTGTLNQITAEQINDVLEYPNTELIAIHSAAVYDNNVADEMARIMTNIEVSLAAGRIPVVVIDTLLQSRSDADALSLSERVRNFGHIVAALLGCIALKTAEQYALRNLVISGGKTASSICSTAEISTINLERELLPGIPVGKVVGGSCDGLYLVTKAGGFGRRNSLRKVLELL